jgi:hypothetical protein
MMAEFVPLHQGILTGSNYSAIVLINRLLGGIPALPLMMCIVDFHPTVAIGPDRNPSSHHTLESGTNPLQKLESRFPISRRSTHPQIIMTMGPAAVQLRRMEPLL